MRFPDKITTFNESILRLLPIILDELSCGDMTPTDLYKVLKRKASIMEYIDALDCLFMLGKLELNQQSEVLHYVA